MSLAYYNEIDPYAADWLHNLINAGLIAPGHVDQRSIEDVRPGDLAGYTQCHFFAGIGVWSYALRRAGWPDSRAGMPPSLVAYHCGDRHRVLAPGGLLLKPDQFRAVFATGAGTL